jgi:hypothetical protein
MFRVAFAYLPITGIIATSGKSNIRNVMLAGIA